MDDLRQALRAVRKQPAFAAVAVLTLAFGIGVNVTLFSMISAFFLQPLPIVDSHQLVVVMQRSDALNIPYGHSYPDYREYRESVKAFSQVAAYMPTPAHLSARGRDAERTWIEVVSPNYFELAGVAPAAGRFPPTGDTSRSEPVVVLSHRYWQRRFGADPTLVGQLITINGRAFTVIGIAPEGFSGLGWAMAVSAYVPAGAAGALMDGGQGLLESRGSPAWRLIGRLHPDATIANARSEIEGVAARLASEYPAEHRGARVLVIPENRSRPDPAIAGFLPIFAVVFVGMSAVVLLIACANVANLMLARAAERQRDLVIRSALGASRWRLIRMLVVESLVLAAIAGGVGVLLAQWAGDALAAFTPTGDIPLNDQRTAGWLPYAFTFAVSAAAGVLTGIMPALRATRFNLTESLKQGAGTTTRSRHLLRNSLVIGQVTMSLVVLAASGLFLQSLRQMKKLDLGFRPDGLFMLSFDLGLQQYDDTRGRRFLEELLRRVESLPGVTSASTASHVPFEHAAQFIDVRPEGDIAGTRDGVLSTAYTVVGPGFFDTLNTPVLRGRGLELTDTERSRRVAVVNETMARHLWPGQEALGRRIRLGRRDDWIEIVGVARDGRYVMLSERPRPYLYLPLAQNYRSPLTLVVRSASDPAALAGPVRKVLAGIDTALPTFNERTMNDLLRDSVFALMPLRIAAVIAGTQGAIGLFLAVLGLYAVVAFTAARRGREIGVRIALGADPADVIRLVVRDGMRLSIIGIALGVAIAAGVGFVLSKVLHGLAALDVAVFIVVIGTLVAVSAAACYLPAQRATRVDPLMALRTE